MVTELQNKSKEELIELILKANGRRKRESAKWKKEARLFRDGFIRERDDKAKMCSEFTKYRKQIEQRERLLSHDEQYYLEWKDKVKTLAEIEGKRLAYVEHMKRCNKCEGRKWHSLYKAKIKGMQEYVTQMLKFVSDVMRTPDIPDNEKARMVDMRNSLIDSRELLSKMSDDKSNIPDEWTGSTIKSV